MEGYIFLSREKVVLKFAYFDFGDQVEEPR